MEGVINIFKNTGMTSFDVVRKIKKLSKTGKVGHTGTLDPEACGVLPVCIGKGTKIIDYIMRAPKIYTVEFKLGTKTTTYDLEGEVLEENDYSFLTEEDILTSINKFKGEYNQVPPMYSALKQNGVRLYELARKGIEVEREGRLITIYFIEDICIEKPFVKMKVKCSKGTYIRSLCYDIGEDLKVGAVMTKLKRNATSNFLEEDSINIENLTEENIEEYIIPIDKALEAYDKLIIKNKFSKLIKNGAKVYDKRLYVTKAQLGVLYRVYDEDDNFIGLGKKDEKGFKLEKLLV
ncbi:tRNA pseudouridine(55) synthase TruB [Clostridium thermobutyricum]|uniref:tRNA pseudouridine synthase B n=1 Tax=Clostridium thermobutyricum DSM 4928 TaxID=1121339 RepID=A0A1V4SZ68_9CLOT|nr:tRNA pseudouridine(55) synthase TruB [Clostridium thermobutyricum]OPX51220.1 tRNA pseudouridine synthase B [Clostridium thermobutyricum DSM 4928]